MKHLWRALFFVLVLGVFMPSRSAAQGTTQTGGGQGAGLQLGQNYPNPVNQDTRIPFIIGFTICWRSSSLCRFCRVVGTLPAASRWMDCS